MSRKTIPAWLATAAGVAVSLGVALPARAQMPPPGQPPMVPPGGVVPPGGPLPPGPGGVMVAPGAVAAPIPPPTPAMGGYDYLKPTVVYRPLDKWFYYPYYYFPHSYWPSMGPKWPEQPGQHTLPPPAYMSYPPLMEPHWRYEWWEKQWYYRGFHFWLDQF